MEEEKNERNMKYFFLIFKKLQKNFEFFNKL